MYSFDVAQHDAIARACKRYGVEQLDLFGSRAKGTARATESDFDFLVVYKRDPAPGSDYLHHEHLRSDLEAIVGTKVDLIDVRNVVNPVFLGVAMKTRQRVYAS